MAWIGAAASIVGGMMASDAQSSAASDAASKSAEASKYAADIQKQMYDQTRTDQTPWREGGQNALARLLYGMGIDSNSSNANQPESRAQIMSRFAPQYTTQTDPAQSQFRALDPDHLGLSLWENSNWNGDPVGVNRSSSVINQAGLDAAVDAEFSKQQSAAQGQVSQAHGSDFGALSKSFGLDDFRADPGYAFRLAEGQRGLDNSAAARGGLQSGNALKAAARYGQDMGSQEYGNAYNRYNTNQTNQFNRLSSLAGVGQTANNTLASAGANYANQAGNYSMVNGVNQAGAALAGGNSRAASYTGLGKALGGINWGGSTTTPDPWGGSYDAFNNPDNYG